MNETGNPLVAIAINHLLWQQDEVVNRASVFGYANLASLLRCTKYGAGFLYISYK